ncbi:hypothetical protein CLI64_11415 [Nostoc sp. CENA543]|nr:hypothetical protein CLI64_11415 [Nostoc sp. CENA543]
MGTEDSEDGEVWGVWGVWGERFLPYPPTPPTPPTLPACPMPNALKTLFLLGTLKDRAYDQANYCLTIIPRWKI